MYQLAKDRIRHIADGLVGVIDTHVRDEVFIYPILDYLMLLPHPQRPLIISMYSQSTPDVPIYCTMQDPEIKPKCIDFLSREESRGRLVSIGNTDFLIGIHTYSIPEQADHPEITSLPNHDLVEFESLFSLLQNDPYGRRVLDFIKQKLEALKTESSWEESLMVRSGDIPLTENKIQEYLKRMRRAIDETLGEYWESPLISSFPGGESLPLKNLFCVIKTKINQTRHNNFNYTARVLLSTAQHEAINKLLGDRVVQQLENPLGLTYRSIADTVFSSGTVDFSPDAPGQGRDSGSRPLSDNSSDRRRREAEEIVYGRIRPDEEHKTVFYIPIHVSGSPWLLLFSLAPPKNPIDDLTWAHNYKIYRDLISKVADRFRGAVRSLYLELVSEELANALSDPDPSTFLSRVNRAWKSLTYVYPHRGVEFVTEADENPTDISLPNGQRVYLKLYENPYYRRQIDFDLLQKPEVSRACETAIRTDREKRNAIRGGIYSAFLSHRHTMLNRNPWSTLQAALLSGPQELSGEARLLVEDAAKITQVLNVSLLDALGISNTWPFSTVTELLKWLKANTPSSEVTPDLRIDQGISDTPLDRGQIADAFTVLWNLWHNASKIYIKPRPPRFDVHVSQKDGGLNIRFENRGGMTRPWIEYLKGRADSPNKKSDRRGLEIVKEILAKLEWSIGTVEVTNKSTVIEVRIPRNRFRPRRQST